MAEFQVFPKIARLNRDIAITEKIDGTNAAVGVEDITDTYEDYMPISNKPDPSGYFCVALGGRAYHVYAQSRHRFVTPDDDHHGFARWVYDNAESLVKLLGPGLHFGEWWGSGIQRGYDLPKGMKKFSLFNTKRWGWIQDSTKCGPFALMPPELDVVPTLYQGPFSTGEVRIQLACLEAFGSKASPGFANPEGLVVYHTAGNVMFKVTIKDDEVPKTVTNPKLVEVSLDYEENPFEAAKRRNEEEIMKIFGLWESVA